MDINTKLIIKVQLNDEIRKMPIHNEDITYDELIIMMERVFKHKLNPEDEITIKYKDEDNDLIIISDDSDLAFAIEGSNILKLSLTIENNSSKEESSKTRTGELGADEVNIIRKELQIIRDRTNSLLDKLMFTNNGDLGSNIALISGRDSSTGNVGGGREFQEIGGGKEFDPLSVANHLPYPVSRTESGNVIVSNNRNETNEHVEQLRQTGQTPMNSEGNEIHRPSPINMTKNQMQHEAVFNPMTAGYNSVQQPTMVNSSAPIMSPNMNFAPGHQNAPGTMIGKKMPPNMQGPNMPPIIGGSNLPPSNIGNQNMHPSNAGNQNMHPSNAGNQNMHPSNAGNQNMHPSNAGNQNMHPSYAGNQNMNPSNIGNQNMQPNIGGMQNIPPNMSPGPNMHPNMGGCNVPGQNLPPTMPGLSMPPSMPSQNLPPNMGSQNLPVNMPNQNLPKTMDNPMSSAPSAFTGAPLTSGFNNSQQMHGGPRQFYPNAMQPPRMSSSNFQGANPMVTSGGMQARPQGPYFIAPTIGPQSNPAMSQQNVNYGYQSTQK